MSEIKFRPRFRIETSLNQKETAELIKQKVLHDNPDACESSIIEGHLILKINVKNRHFWSPQMDISLSELENKKGTLIRCLLAPAPAIWTMFMFFYTVVSFVAFIGIMIGLSQWTPEKEMWGMNNPAASYEESIRKDLEFDESMGVLNSYIPTTLLSGFVRLTTQIAWSLTNKAHFAFPCSWLNSFLP